MKKLASRSKTPHEIPAASMSDVAFLLLIFFLVTTIFAFDNGIPLLLPRSDAPPKKYKNLLVVRIDPAGDLSIGGNPVRLEDLRSTVERRRLSDPKLTVVIQSHRESPYGVLIDVFDELRLADVRRVSLSTVATDI